MRQPKQRREITHERNLARRVQQERERRGWTYEALAKAVTDSGCLMHPSTPFKIEKGDPPRRITIDEFIALSKVFGLSLEELVIAPEVAAEAKAARVETLKERYVTVVQEDPESPDKLSAIMAELSTLCGGPDKAAEALLAHVVGRVLGKPDASGAPRQLPG